jgi:membrane-associated phospholipid phosphatase
VASDRAGPGFSFPSAHAAASLTFAAVVVAIAWPTRWRRLAVAVGATFVFAVGLSRVYLGVHYPSDVLAGWCVASVWTLAVLALWTLVARRITAGALVRQRGRG